MGETRLFRCLFVEASQSRGWWLFRYRLFVPAGDIFSSLWSISSWRNRRVVWGTLRSVLWGRLYQ